MDFSEPLWLQFVAQRKSANIRIETKSLVSWTISKLHHIHNPADRRQSLAAEPGLGWTVVGFYLVTNTKFMT